MILQSSALLILIFSIEFLIVVSSITYDDYKWKGPVNTNFVWKEYQNCENGFCEKQCDYNAATKLQSLYNGAECDRECAIGRDPRICYFRFVIECQNTMGYSCGDCRNGTMKDCQNAGCIPANGVERPIKTINRQLPGPTIVICKDDQLVVDVVNHMPGEETTIHWHGFLQKETPFMDGVPMVTQCPISSGAIFRYRMTARNAGTFFYHSHSGLQRAEGLHGALVVRQPRELDPNGRLYDFDLKEHSLVITDWMNRPAEDFATGLRSTRLAVDSILVNGYGTFFDHDKNKSTKTPLAVLYFLRNTRYRLRFIDASSQNCPFRIDIAGHDLTVIATDSYSVEATNVSSIYLEAGERYDVVLHTTNNKTIDHGLIRVQAFGPCSNVTAYVKIVFIDDPEKYNRLPEHHSPENDVHNLLNSSWKNTLPALNNPLTKCDKSTDLCVTDLHYNGNNDAQCVRLINRTADVVHRVSFDVTPMYSLDAPIHYLSAGNIRLVANIDNISSVGLPFPPLTQNDSLLHNHYCNASYRPSGIKSSAIDFCPHMIRLPKDKIVDLHLCDTALTPGKISHVFHLHGYHFCVLYVGDRFEEGTFAYTNKGKNPVVKDTIVIPSAGCAVIRVFTDNPGFWLFHCHFEWHMHIGMMAIVKVGEKNDMVPPPNNFPTCGNYLPSIYGNC